VPTAAELHGAEAQAYLETQVRQLRKVYEAAARELERVLASASSTDFARFRATEHLNQIRAIIAALDVKARDLTEKACPLAYRRGADIGAEALADQGVRASLNLGNKIHTRGVSAIVDQMTMDLLLANGTLREHAERFVRKAQVAASQDAAMFDIVAQGIAGGQTRRDVSSRIRDELVKALKDGAKIEITGKDGKIRQYDPGKYAELVARTRTREAVTAGAINMGEEYGVDLFQVSFHASSCPQCVPFQGRVYSLRGATAGFPVLTERPPYHPRCAHVLLPYISVPGKESETEALRKFSNDSGRTVANNEDYRKVVDPKRKR
jgi:hypothetical protein